MRLNLGPFAIGERIGRGGMGVIHAAVHRTTGFQAAVKIVTGGPDTETARATFREEVRAVAGLRHPHIVRVFDYGTLPAETGHEELSAGMPYLVMERAACTLAQRPRYAEWRHVRGILLALLDALAHAHARGVVHCDLKLSNVLMDGVRPGLKLADFGIAQALGDRHRDPTRNAKSAGTPTYMAPEQFTGNVRDFGPWTDLYALGVMAWKLVTGRAPFRQRAWLQLMRAHTREPLPALKANQSVPPEFEDWLGWLLAKDLRSRCNRAADAAVALRGMCEPQAIAKQPARPLGNDRATVPDGGAGPVGVTLAWHGQQMAARPTDEPVVERPIPSMPGSWVRGKAPPTPPAMAGVGQGLFGLRRSPMVGREATRDSLWRALTAARSEPQFTLLTGPGGVGKTRLANWLSRRSHEVGAAVVLQATHGPTPSATDGLAAMFRRHLVCDGLSPEDIRVRLMRRFRISSARAATLSTTLASPDPDRPAIGTHAQFAVAVALLDAVATTDRRRILLVLDDLQWGEHAVAFAAFLVESPRARHLPLHVVGTVRTPTQGADLLALRNRPEVQSIDVGPLPHPDQERLVGGLLGLAPTVARTVAERSEGVPLFAVELLRDWVERDQLEPSPLGYELRSDADQIPDDIAVIWERRLGAVLKRDAAWHSLELAAVLGREVALTEWQAVCGDAGTPCGAHLLERLYVAGLCLPTPSGWRFAHGLLHESLMRRADRAHRLEGHHERCAKHVTDRERCGLHHWGAQAYASSVVPLLGGAWSRDDLGERARSRWLLDRCRAALERAGVGEEDERTHQVRVRMAGSYTRYEGDLEASEALLRPAIALAREHQWPWLSRVLGDLAGIYQRRGDLATATTLIDEAVRAAPRSGRPIDLTSARVRQAQVAKDAGQIQRSIAIATAVISDDQAEGQPALLAHAFTVLSSGANQNGDPEAGIVWAQKALEHFKAAEDRVGILDALLYLGSARWYAGDVAGAERDFEEGVALASLLGTWNILYFEINLGMITLGREQYQEARSCFDRAMAQVADERIHLEAALHAFLVPATGALGDWAAFDRHLESAERLLAQTGFADGDISKTLSQGSRFAAEAGHVQRAELAAGLAKRELARLKGG